MGWPLPDRAVLGIFAKQPVPGEVKTRLSAEFGAEVAASISEAMLFDLLDLWGSERVLAPGGRRVLAFDPPDAGPWFDARVPEAFSLQAQDEGDLGRRMASFFAGEFADGAKAVVLIGSDAPALDPSVVVSAFLCLESRDVVVGPSADGGYYLIGARGEVPPVFDGVDWSTTTVLSRTVERLNETGLTLGVLPPCYDVDTPDDWRALAGHVRALRRSGMNPGLPRVEAAIEETVPRGGTRLAHD